MAGPASALPSCSWFEEATTLGEETSDPERAIPVAVFGTVVAALMFYVLVSYAQVVGYGIENAALLGQASAPLDELSTRFISGGFAGFLDLAATVSALACTIGALSAAARMLFALSRAGLLPGLDGRSAAWDAGARWAR
jgi:amino acid transporter